jgi:hypothetical protein
MLSFPPERHLQIELDAFGSPVELGPGLAAACERVVEEVLRPLAGGGPPATSIGWELADGTSKGGRWDEQRFQSTLEALREGELLSLTVGGDPADPPRGTLTVSLLGRVFEGASQHLWVVAPESVLPVASPSVQRRWVEVACAAASLTTAATGWITRDCPGFHQSPYESGTGASVKDSVQQAREKLRGYYWGNFLSAGHIAALGGKARIEREAPCVAVVDQSTPAHELLFLQLTEQVDHYGDDDLRRLRDYLRPLLQPPSEKAFTLIGPPPRLVE